MTHASAPGIRDAVGSGRLTTQQRAIVEFGDGPIVVIAGAGTGKTKVIVERVRWLLETKGSGTADADGRLIPAEPAGPEARPRDDHQRDDHQRDEAARDDPFAGALVPEQILVLTYNVKAARELGTRFDACLSPSVRGRLRVGNFHSFCHQVLTDESAEAGLRPNPDVLDGIGQILLLRDLRPDLPLVYHAGASNPNQWLEPFVSFINRAKDELVTPDDIDAYVEGERRAFEVRFGDFEAALDRVAAQGDLRGPRDVRGAYAALRRQERAGARDGTLDADLGGLDLAPVQKIAEREARRTVGGNGSAVARSRLTREQGGLVDALAQTYVVDGAALEVLRLSELALVYHAYQDELGRRGVLDFGEQIAAVTRLFKARPNVLRRYQRQFRYILVDEFQDANIAQIELVELLGRTPDRLDNVMVVGDDDQSIYRFRGASHAAFGEFTRRFERPPAHDPTAPPPGPPPVLWIDENFRSVDNVLVAANRLIARNTTRFEPDKRLATQRPSGNPVQVIVCAGADDEAVAIVDSIKALVRPDDCPAGTKPAWADVAILYRKHRHREAIVTRLRDEDIPYTVVGGLSLFDTPEIRDLEQSLRAIADPHQDICLVRMMSSGPWRLDALEILEVARMAKFDRRHVVDAAREIVRSGQVEVERPNDAAVDAAEVGDPVAVGEAGDTCEAAGGPGSGEGAGCAGVPLLTPTIDLASPVDIGATMAEGGAPSPRHPATAREPVDPRTRAKLRRLLETLEELTPLTWREGPFTILERLLERTSQVLDLVATDSLAAMRMVSNIASFLRFAHDWQTEHPEGSLAGFVDYLDAYKGAAGELAASVELTEEVDGVRLMTVYQAKGLEFPYVFVPCLLAGEWPTRSLGGGLFPDDLLREVLPSGDIHTDEERRLLYVAMTRAQERLFLTTHGGPSALKEQSLFVPEVLEGAGPELSRIDRTASAGLLPGSMATGLLVGAMDGPDAPFGAPLGDSDEAISDDLGRTAALVRRIMPLPTRRERRLELRLRAGELVSLLESTSGDDPESVAARARFEADLAAVGRSAAVEADRARALGLDPLTMRVVALDSAAGANLLDVAPLPARFSYSALHTYEACPAQYAFQYIYRIPTSRTVAAFTFGTTAHAAFEAFTRERRERLARGEPGPTREDLDRLFRAEWKPVDFGDKLVEETYERRVTGLLDNFWAGELNGPGRPEHEELWFDLTIEPGDGTAPVVFGGSIDRVDRLPSGGIEIIDYKTGRMGSQKSVDESLQLSIYALACRDTLGLGTPERVTLYYTESAARLSTTRTDEQLDAARADILARVAQIRSGDFTAAPSSGPCHWCDYAALCPS